MRAFAHNRILLRPLSERERLDLTRRLTGDMAGAASYARPLPVALPTTRVAALSGALASAAALSSRARAGENVANDVAALADRLLRVDPASPSLQAVSQRFSGSALALKRGQTAASRELLDGAAAALAEVLRAELPTGTAIPRSAERAALDGALRLVPAATAARSHH